MDLKITDMTLYIDGEETPRATHIEYKGVRYSYVNLVYWAATGERPNRNQAITHANGDLTDNRIENLRLVAKGENKK